MLIHANDQPRIPTGFCCVGSSAVSGRGAVRAGRVASGGGADHGRDDGRRESLASDLAGEGAVRPEGGGPGGPQAAAHPKALGADRAGPASGPAGPRVQHRVVDVAPDRADDRALDRGGASSRPCVAGAARIGLVPAATRPARARTRRSGDRRVEDTTLGAAKKNARHRRGWLVFEDESGVSQHPVVRRTWAPRGQTPVLIHTGANWKRLSVAARPPPGVRVDPGDRAGDRGQMGARRGAANCGLTSRKHYRIVLRSRVVLTWWFTTPSPPFVRKTPRTRRGCKP